MSWITSPRTPLAENNSSTGYEPNDHFITEWPVNPFARSDFSRPSLPLGVPSGEQQRVALPASERSRWRQDALQVQPQILQRTTGWDGCGTFFPKACDVLLGTPGALSDLFSPDNGTENSNSNISKDSLTPTTLYVSRRCMECVNSTLHTSHFRTDLHAHAWLKSCVCRAHITRHVSSSCAHVVVLI